VIEDREYTFLLNFRAQPAAVDLNAKSFIDAETREPITGLLALKPFDSRVLLRE
jgi:beta-galactosidase GanA